jgi:molybdopterin-guanine dinucleotide biosynthesis protein A
MDENKPVTQKQLSAALDSQKAEILEALRETETKLLKAFFQYQEVVNIRLHKLTTDVSNIDTSSDLRFNNLEQRVVQLEKRIMMP